MSLSGPGSILAGDVATFICVSHNVSGHSTFRWHIILKSELSLTTVRIVCGSVFQPIRLHYPIQSEMEPHTTLPIVSDNALFKTMWSEMIFRAYSHARKNRPHEIWKLSPGGTFKLQQQDHFLWDIGTLWPLKDSRVYNAHLEILFQVVYWQHGAARPHRYSGDWRQTQKHPQVGNFWWYWKYIQDMFISWYS